VVSPSGDETLRLAYFLQSGTVLNPKRGIGQALKAANTKRVAAQVLQLEPSEVPALIDGSERFVIDVLFPNRGFTKQTFAEREGRAAAVAEAYEKTQRHDAANTVRSWLQDVKAGLQSCEEEKSQIAERTESGPVQIAALVESSKLVLRKDSGGRPRILFHLAETALRPDAGIVKEVGDPGHRARQLSRLLDASKDLRARWDSTAPGRELGLVFQGLARADQGLVRADQVLIGLLET